MKKTNTLRYGLSCGLGSFISGAIALQFFGNSLLWGVIGAIIGIFAGLIVAMFASDPKGFPAAAGEAFARATEGATTADYSQFVARLKFIFWTGLLVLSLLEILFCMVSLIEGSFIIDWRMVPTILLLLLILPAVLSVSMPEVETGTRLYRKAILYANLVALPFYLLIWAYKAGEWCWNRRIKISRGVKVFLAHMYLYIHTNGGLAILLHVSAATGVGLYFGNVFVCAATGFILGFIDHFVHSKSHEHLLALVGKEE